ncbi:MAG TPA: PadR family transcriptional regulator [Candidatus Acidoferrales bacterium]|nr:PadR family transcriptional regulator [Candidatus Acidoferrales bacterium]
MSTRAASTDSSERLALLQGTLDLLILRTLLFGPEHGQGIARAIQQNSDDALLVEHGALYPALQRLEERGWIAAGWGTSDNNRRARFYRLTALGRKQLVRETGKWRRLAAAIGRVLGPEMEQS